MRRLIVAILLIVVPVLAVAPAFANPGSLGPAAATPVKEGKSAAKCPKGKKCPPKKKATPTPTKKKKKATPTPVKKRPSPTAAAKPAPASTTVPSPTATSTATSTPTLTPTITPTPTPLPSRSQITVRANIPAGYSAAFFVCGLPAGVSASFTPNPATSGDGGDDASTTGAQSTLILSSAWYTNPNSYGLELWAYYHDAQGNPVTTGASAVQPNDVVLTVDANHQTTLAAAQGIPATNFQNCSALPAGFAKPVPPTASPGSVSVTSWVSNPHPAANEQVIAYGKFTVAGVPVRDVPVTFNWYGPVARPGCSTYTAPDGTASCISTNRNPLPGYAVLVQVTFQYQGQTYTSYTSYTM